MGQEPIEYHLPEQGACSQGAEADFGQDPAGVNGQDEESGQLGRSFRVAASGEHVAARQDQGDHDDGEHEQPEEQGGEFAGESRSSARFQGPRTSK